MHKTDIEVYQLFLPEKGVKWPNMGMKVTLASGIFSCASNELLKVQFALYLGHFICAIYINCIL